jgi:hypothetical protein
MEGLRHEGGHRQGDRRAPQRPDSRLDLDFRPQGPLPCRDGLVREAIDRVTALVPGIPIRAVGGVEAEAPCQR